MFNTAASQHVKAQELARSHPPGSGLGVWLVRNVACFASMRIVPVWAFSWNSASMTLLYIFILCYCSSSLLHIIPSQGSFPHSSASTFKWYVQIQDTSNRTACPTWKTSPAPLRSHRWTFVLRHHCGWTRLCRCQTGSCRSFRSCETE